MELDADDYADKADVVITRTAKAPEGYNFVGWVIRGDTSNTVYYPGQSFEFDTKYAVTVNRRETVFLDAVYTRVGTAKIIYDANGGEVYDTDPDGGELDCGWPTDPDAPTPVVEHDGQSATLSNLVNNSGIRLSGGEGFWREKATLLGWSTEPDYDPDDPDAVLYEPDGEYYVDMEEPVTLYAIWQANVYFHLNKNTGEASWGGAWDPSVYTLSDAGDYYTRTAILGVPLDRPEHDPSYTGADNLMFHAWRTERYGDCEAEDDETVYDFSRILTGELHLYAYWDGPIEVPVHGVDASDETPEDRLVWRTQEYIPVTEREVSVATAADAANYVSAPAGYVFAFTAAHDSTVDLRELSEDEAITSVYYNSDDRKVHVVYADAGRGDAPLADEDEIYFIYYREKPLSIGYRRVHTDGAMEQKLPDSATGDLGTYDMAAGISTPLTSAGYANNDKTYFAFAVGEPDAATIADIQVITASGNNQNARPTLRVRNTWRGFEYTLDGSAWVRCGFDVQLYVLYFESQPTVVTIRESTVGTTEDMDEVFEYRAVVTETITTTTSVQTQQWYQRYFWSTGSWQDYGDPVVTTTASDPAEVFNNESDPFLLSDGETRAVTLFYSSDQSRTEGEEYTRNSTTYRDITTTTTTVVQTLTLVQAPRAGFVTSADATAGTVAPPCDYTYTTTETIATPTVTYTNTHTPLVVEVHVALVDGDDLAVDDGLRSADPADYRFVLGLGNSETLLTRLPADALFTGGDEYAFAGVAFGSGEDAPGSPVAAAGLGVASVAYRQQTPPDGNVYELELSDADGEALGRLGTRKLYYVFYKKPRAVYVREGSGGTLNRIRGFLDGETVVDRLTYNGAPLTLNGAEVAQEQPLPVSADALTISQAVGANLFNMPPTLDDGTDRLYLIYTKLGVGGPDAATSGELEAVTADRTLHLRLSDEYAVQWSLDGSDWHSFADAPTVYAIYKELGHEFEVTKAIPNEIEGSPVRSFTVTISSMSITETSYPVSGTGYNTVSATPVNGSTPGRIVLTVRQGSAITISGLPKDDYTVVEAGGYGYTLTAKQGSVESTLSDAEVTDFSFGLTLTGDTKVELTNTRRPICKIVDGGVEVPFATLNAALDYMSEHDLEKATIEMLLDYDMPASDALQIPGDYDITLTTASKTEGEYRYEPSDGASDAATLKRAPGFTGAMFTNDGSFALENVALDGNGGSVTASGAMIRNRGELAVGDGATLKNANSTANGGAIYGESGSITVAEGASLTGNTAALGGAIYATVGDIAIEGGSLSGNRAFSGGAIYYTGTGTLSITGDAALTGNTATTGSGGGAIYAGSGTVNVLGGSVEGNRATSGNGGAIYASSAVVNVSGSAGITGNTAVGGGAIHAQSGTVNVTGGAITGNTASRGNGGAIQVQSGAVNVTGGAISNNAAAGGNGGAIYTATGTITVAGGSLEGNAAINGSAVYAEAGVANFSGGTVTGNTATRGGAVGVGGASAKLYFSQSPVITGNTMGGEASNVYLDVDSDMVINAASLAASAEVGVYVPGEMTAELFRNRGEACARFGSFTTDANLSIFKNDRIPSLTAMSGPNNKIIWGKPIRVEVRYLASYSGGFPPANAGRTIYTQDAYYPQTSENTVSDIEAELYDRYRGSLSGTAAFAAIFPFGATAFGQYLTDVNWDSASGSWGLVGRDGSIVRNLDSIVIYYAEPAYVNIENNTDFTLDLSAMTVLGVSAANSDTVAGYGYVVARNGVMQSSLAPITAQDLQLEPWYSIKLLFPGGCSAAYVLDGHYDFGAATPEGIDLRRTDAAKETIPAAEASGGFVRSGTTVSTSGGNTNIIFGGDKPICKIVDEHGENVFTRIEYAVAYAVEHREENGKRAKIEMLVDYLMPASDKAVIPAGYDITLTTATTGEKKYSSDPDARATISRDTENTGSLITVPSGDLNTALTLENLIFDGKSIRGNSDGGAVNTSNCRVTVRNVDFANVYAGNGGALYVSVGKGRANSTLEVVNCRFVKCNSTKASGSRLGGGAIHAFVDNLILTDCEFESCEAADQAGAVFHRVDSDYASTSRIERCTFTNCTAKAAGALETDAKNITVTDCQFSGCVASDRNGGAMNVYALNAATPTVDCWVTVTGCTFDDCRATNLGSGDRYGGALRSNAVYTTISNCSFSGTSAKHGGAFAMSNTNAKTAEVYGCTIDGAVASERGGGIYCTALSLTIGDYVDEDGRSWPTTISNCVAGQHGGGVFHSRSAVNSVLTVENATLSGNTSTNGAGGGIHTNAFKVALTDCEVLNNTAKGNGGGICDDANANDRTLLVDGCTISGNTSSAQGGGIYANARLTLRNGTVVSGNRLTTSTVANGAGVYMANRTLVVGTEGASEPDASSVRGNEVSGGTASNLRLWMNGINSHASSVSVLCGLSGEFGVANASSKGTQFGSSVIARPAGFADLNHVFTADDGSLYGVVDRTDANGKKLIWRMPPICKITDEDGNLLFLDQAGTEPAVFDALDNGTGSQTLQGAFGWLKTSGRPALYDAHGELYDGNTYCIKMLVENYTVKKYITSTAAAGRTIVFTTASASDTDGYPYRGRTGTRAKIIRGAGLGGSNLLTARVNLVLEDIILDGGSKDGIASGDRGRLINAPTANTLITLGRNATLQNVSGDFNGAGIYMEGGVSLTINGGTIKNCEGRNGGGVYNNSANSKIDIISGTISRCTATGNGGGVYMQRGELILRANGSVTRCSATQGGGVYVSNNLRLTVNGGSITANRASDNGGGVLVTGDGARVYFSGRVSVSGNRLGSGALNNIELPARNSGNYNKILNADGIESGSDIGVYVPGERTASPFIDHGEALDPFGSYVAGTSTDYLYSFVNDRNGLKGGLIPGGAANTVYWVEMFSLEVSKLVLSDDAADAARPYSFRVTLGDTSIGGTYGDVTFTNGVATFSLMTGESVTAEDLPQGVSYTVEELLDEAQQAYFTIRPGVVQQGEIGENLAREDVDFKYLSTAAFTNLHAVCKLTDSDGNVLYYQDEAGGYVPAVYSRVATAFATLNADVPLFSRDADEMTPYGGASATYGVELLVPEYAMTEAVTLNSGKTVTLTTADPHAEDGFPYAGEGDTATVSRGYDGASLFAVRGSLTVQRLVLDGMGTDGTAARRATGNGGAFNVVAGGALKLTDGAVLQDFTATGSGGAVYVADGGAMALEGTPSLVGNRLTGSVEARKGAAICLAQGASLTLKDAPTFSGNCVVDASMAGKQNGPDAMTAEVRQDIYVAGGVGANSAAIAVIGPMDLGEGNARAGSIWVWAEAEDHYKSGTQFATYRDVPAAQLEATLTVFRNARDNDHTEADADEYLTGVVGDADGLVNWSGGKEVEFLKIDGFGEPLPGARFSLYDSYAHAAARGSEGLVQVRTETVVDGETVTQKTDEAVSGADGKVIFKVKNGVFYLAERNEKSETWPYATDLIYIALVGSGAITIPAAAERSADALWGTDGPLSDITEADLEAQLGTGASRRDYALFPVDAATQKAAATADLAAFGLLNESAAGRRVILKKIDGATYEALVGARFHLFRADLSEVTEGQAADGAGKPVGYYTSGDAGAWFIGRLPLGRYYLLETRAPSDDYAGNVGKAFVLEVRRNAATGDIEAVVTEDPALKIAVSGTEADGVNGFRRLMKERTASGTTDTGD